MLRGVSPVGRQQAGAAAAKTEEKGPEPPSGSNGVMVLPSCIKMIAGRCWRIERVTRGTHPHKEASALFCIAVHRGDDRRIEGSEGTNERRNKGGGD